MEISLSQDAPFKEQVDSNEHLARFKDLLDRFLRQVFFQDIGLEPTRIEFTMFRDPDSGIARPMVEIFMPGKEHVTRSALQHSFISMLKAFLARHAKDADEFVSLRREQRHFMSVFIIE